MIPRLRRYECFVVVFFAYVASLAVLMRRPVGVVAALIAVGVVCGIARVDEAASRPWSRVLRDWMAPGYVLAAYWSLAPLARGSEARHFGHLWIHWDRVLLQDYGLRRLVEAAGAFGPASLELLYLLLYGLPSALIGWFYWRHRRDRLECFLETLFACTLLTYALIPLMPSAPPRLEFAGHDLPHYLSALRRLNLWLQDGVDITTGVFPSGHVTAALACALGLRRALPGDVALFRGLSVYAALLMVITIYGRYHYAADVVAAAGVSLVGVVALEWQAIVPELAYARWRSPS